MKKLTRTLILFAATKDVAVADTTNSTTTTTVLPTSMAEYSVTSISSISASVMTVVIAAAFLN